MFAGAVVSDLKMTIIVRLQGLPPVADSFDVRQFFYGLNIPRGGVYITGGKYGEAFIIFGSLEDAQYAMTLSGRPLKTSYIYLSYSNELEMRRALEVYRIGPNDSLGGLSSGMSQRTTPRVQGGAKPSFLYIHGMSQKITKVELREFFKGFTVEDVIFLKFVSGVRNGNALIKFKGTNEASEGLKLDGVFLGGSPVALRLSDEDEWDKNGGDSNVPKRERSPPPRRSPPRRAMRRSPRRSPPRRRRRTRSRSPRRERRRSPYIREFYVHLINVSYRAEKADIKKFFFDLDMDDSHITFLLDKDGKRTREAFAMFTTQKDYKRALNLNLDSFKGHTINILPISKKGMLELIDRRKSGGSGGRSSRKSESSQEHRKFVFLRNFAANITKADVVAFFKDFPLKEDDVTLLIDDKGVGLGEALAKFADEKEASKAEKLNHEKYQDTEILLSRISQEQMKALTKGNGSDKESAKPEDSMVSQATDVPETTDEAYAQEAENSDQVQKDLDASKKNDGEKVAANKENDGKNEMDAGKEKGEKDLDVKENGDKEKDADQEMDGHKEKDEEMDVTPPLDSEESEHVDSTGPLPESDSAAECLDDSVVESENDINGANKVLSEGMTLMFIRNLPVTTTSAEIVDFLQDYKVSSVNLKYIGKGEATVRMSDAEAKSAIETLNKKEVGLKQVLLSLI